VDISKWYLVRYPKDLIEKKIELKNQYKTQIPLIRRQMVLQEEKGLLLINPFFLTREMFKNKLYYLRRNEKHMSSIHRFVCDAPMHNITNNIILNF